MEIKNNKRVIVSGRMICLIAGILTAICGIYWIVKALVCDETNLPAILGSTTIALFLTLYGTKR